MKRIQNILLSTLAALPVSVYALGLGQIELESGLNQPFEARVELISATADELQTLQVDLADIDAFRRAGIDRPFILNNLRFEVHETEAGPEPDYLRIYTVDPVREPYLNFLVEVAWSKGRLFREFTVLLDPPLYDPSARRPAVVEPSVSEYQPVSEPEDEYEFVPEVSDSGEATESYAGSGYTSGEYGPTVASDTLWSIASAIRPDTSVSVQQMMLALLRANPDAFLDNNINGLKRGQVLRIPERDQIMALTQAEALAEARSQNSMWEDTRGAFLSTTPTRPVSSGGEGITGSTETGAEEDTSELRLVAASETGAGTARGDSTGTAAAGDSGESLALANEQLEAVSQENLELKDRLSEAESIIEDLRRLISLKDDELASLQQQVGAAEEAGGESGAMEEELPQEEEAVVPVEIEEVPEETTAAGEEETMEEEAMEEEVVEEPEEDITSVVDTGPIEAPKGLVDQVIDTVMENIVIVGGAAGGIVLLLIGFVFLSRRKKKGEITEEEIEAAAIAAGFTDTSEPEMETITPSEVSEDVGSEDETVLPGDGVEIIEESPAAATEEPVAEAEEEGGVPSEAQEVESEEDPLAEVNVFLAYEHFDQAEEFVRDAIAGDPENLDFHSKLLEVFYASGDKPKYEEAARVLNEKVNGEGPHWEMAVAMWSEMSPNRALFEEGGEDEEEAAAETTGGGVLDLTADDSESAGEAADVGLDFDLGEVGEEAEPAAEEAGPGGEEEDVLDVTAAVPASDLDAEEEDLLDVTAAVGLEPELDSEAGAEGEEEMLDITAGSEEPSEDLLDVSAPGSEDLLDVTAHADIESVGEGEEDLLDVTAVAGEEADSDESLEIGEETGAAEEDDGGLDFDIGGVDEPTLEVPAAEESSDVEEGGLDFDIGGTEDESTEEESTDEDNVIDFDSALGGAEETEAEGLDIGLSDDSGDDSGLEFDMDLGSDSEGSEAEGEIEVDSAGDETMEVDLGDLGAGLETEESKDDSEGLEFDLGLDEAGGEDETGGTEDAGVELDLSIDDSADAGDETMEISMADLETEDGGTEDGGLELDTGDDSKEPEIDLEATEKIPSIDLELDAGSGDEDEDDQTVFVPRSGDNAEQSEEDEIATKLDLAKAYVELGDKDSAKGILEEIINEGNEQQKATAQDLLNQVS